MRLAPSCGFFLAVCGLGCGTLLGLPPEATLESDAGPAAVSDAGADALGSDGAQASDGAREAEPAPDGASGDAGGGSDARSDAGTVPAGWSVLAGTATDVAVGATDDVIWVLGSELQNDGNYPVLQWSASSHTFLPSALAGLALDVTPAGPCVIEKGNTVWVTSGGALTQLSEGLGSDIGAGPNGDMWVISNGEQPGVKDKDMEVFVWTGQFGVNPFKQVTGAWGVHTDVAPDGTAWVVRAGGEVTQVVAGVSRVVPLDGFARDVAAGTDGSLYVVGATTAGSPTLFRYSTALDRFESLLEVDGVRVSAGASRIVVVTRDNRVLSNQP